MNAQVAEKLLWVQPGVRANHVATGTEFQVCQADGSGWWLKRTFDGSLVRYSSGDLLLFFEPMPPLTRFERLDDQ